MLTFDSSIADWRSACDLVGWRKLAKVLNEEWGMTVTDADWRDILEPPGGRTIRNLCEVISRGGLIECIPERGLLGCRSADGRVLRVLRRILLQLGEPRGKIGANALVGPLLSKYGAHFLSPCLRIAPGALPALKPVGRFRKGLVVALSCLLLIAMCCYLSASLAPGLPLLSLGTWSLISGSLAFLLLWIPDPLFRGSVILPGIVTLGDLAECLARGSKVKMQGEDS